MEEKIEEVSGSNKKKVIIITSVCVMIMLLVIGISYALWQTTKVQEDMNIIAGGCFDVSLEGENPINLANAYPIKDTEGEATTPYTFTIKNKCTSEANYDVSLEALTNTTFDSSKIKVMFNEDKKLFDKFSETEKYFENSKDARLLVTGTLKENETVTYNLRLWIDESVTNEDQNKVFDSKIIVKASQIKIETLKDKVNIGDYISMTPTSTSYTPSELTGCTESCTQNTINPSELNLWRVIKKNSDGTVDVVSENVSSTKIVFRGQVGYLNLVKELNTIAAQYTNSKYVQKTRYMGFNSQIDVCSSLEECPEDTGYEIDKDLVKTALGSLVATDISGNILPYWLASRRLNALESSTYSGRYITEEGMLGANQLTSSSGADNPSTFAIRPILTLKADLELGDGTGTSADTAYSLE